jgi:hypothetical protein
MMFKRQAGCEAGSAVTGWFVECKSQEGDSAVAYSEIVVNRNKADIKILSSY